MGGDVQRLFRDAVLAHRNQDHEMAVSLCDSILSKSPEAPEVLNLKAVVLAEYGQMVLARRVMLTALEVSRGNPSDQLRSILFVHAARIFSALDLYADAVSAARHAAELKPSDPSCAYQYARMALLSGKLDEAHEIISECLKDFSEFAEARMLKAEIEMELGQLEQARESYLEIVEQQPQHARAWAGLAALGNTGLDDESIVAGLRKIHQAGNDSEEAPGDWATATFALADTFARDGHYEEAFALYRSANEYLGRVNNWSLTGWQNRVEATISTAKPHQFSGDSHRKPGPLFITGMPRSGSSLLERMISAHPDVAAGGERESMLHIERYLESSGVNAAASGNDLDDEQIKDMRSLYRAGFSEPADVDWYCDKANQNYERVGLIRRLFPESRIIWIVRHPLDTILSCYFQDFQHGLGFTNSLEQLARVYVGHWRLMQTWRVQFGEAINVVIYDHLVSEPERVMKELCTWLDLDYQPQMIQPQLQKKAVRTASTLQVQKPINTRALGRWRHYRKHLADVTSLLETAGIIDGQGQLIEPQPPETGT